MAQISIKEIKVNTPEYEQVWELREEVLRKPLGQSLKNDDL
ncbi:MAG: GNAT family N-acetyltransferase, partial [Bacteroidetes bacterium]|nr:GNAT family N-acetyltransferase [Bacteroidota bacterium]